MFCPNCNEENVSSAKFCKKCGGKLSKIKEGSRPLALDGNNSFLSPEIKHSKRQTDTQIVQVGVEVFTKTQKRIGAVIIVIVILAVGIFVFMVSQSSQKNAAVDNFNSLASNIKQLRVDVLKKITTDETLLSATNKKDLADSKVLDQLQNEIDSTKKLSFDVPSIASDTAAIKLQIQELGTKKGEIQKQLNSLDGVVSAIDASKKKLADQVAAEKEAKLIAAIAPKDSHSITVTDGNGNKEKITIKIGKWVKGSETDLLEKAWKAAGGTGAMPLTGKFDGNVGSVGGTFQPKNAAYVFGTVMIENLTPDFDAKNFAGGNNWVYLGHQFGNVPRVQCLQYSDGLSCEPPVGSTLVRPTMTSNTWGPVSFVIGVQNVFTPNFPEGDPGLTDGDYNLSSVASNLYGQDGLFQIGKSW